MSEELSFTVNQDSSIHQVMDLLRAHFHKELRGRRVTKYVIQPDKMYFLIVDSAQFAENVTAAILLQEYGGTWRALLSPERPWSEEVSSFARAKSLLVEVKKFFLVSCEKLVRVTKTWSMSHAEEESRQFDDEYVAPFYSEISDEGTLARCPKCGAAEIIFPDRRTCSECGTEIVSMSSYSELDEPANEASAPPTVTQEGSLGEGACMVCGMSIRPGERLAYCPKCAGRAHRAHLLEYVHVKGKCPTCHAGLREDELTETLRRKRTATGVQKPR